MEKTQTEILKEILEELSEVRSALNTIESKLARLNIEPQAPIDLELEDENTAIFASALSAEPESDKGHEEPAREDALFDGDMPKDDDMPEDGDIPEDDDLPEVDSLSEAEIIITEGNGSLEQPDDKEVELDIFGMPVVSVNEKLAGTRSRSVAEKMEMKDAWRTAIPGSPVKDVRSAVSLNDRVLFIRDLFKGDAEKFQEAMDRINGMVGLEEMVDYVHREHPEWDLNSQTCYRLMMAVRRKLSSN